jgi:hypothetical protein
MDAVRGELRRPVGWLLPLAIGVIQLAGSAGPRHHGVPGPHWAPLNWFG